MGKITEFNLDLLSHTRSPLCDLMCCANGRMKIEINEIIKIRSLQLFFTQNNDDDVTEMNLTIWSVHCWLFGHDQGHRNLTIFLANLASTLELHRRKTSGRWNQSADNSLNESTRCRFHVKNKQEFLAPLSASHGVGTFFMWRVEKRDPSLERLFYFFSLLFA